MNENVKFRIKEDPSGKRMTGSTNQEITDLDSFLKEANINLDEWKVSHFNQSHSRGKWRFSVSFRPKLPLENTLEDSFAKLHEILTEELPPILLPRVFNTCMKALVVYVADEHVGAYVPENAMYRNDYNAGIYEERKMAILNKIMEESQIHGPFEKIIIISLGDNMDGLGGQTTRGGHPLPQNMSDRTAFDTYLRINKQFWDKLLSSRAAYNYEYHCQTNCNHSGIFGYVTNRGVEIYLNARYPQVKTRIYSRFIDHFKLGIHTIMICHGKDEKNRKVNLPLALNANTNVYIKEYMDYYKIPADASLVHFCKADLHQNASQDGKGFRYRNTLSLFGSSAWIMDNFGNSRPGFSFDIYHLERPEVTESKVYL